MNGIGLMKKTHTIEWKHNLTITEIYVDGKMVGELEPRPFYCDRGHWYVKIELPDIDSADGFPRYYMKEDVARSETEAFLRWRLWKERS